MSSLINTSNAFQSSNTTSTAHLTPPATDSSCANQCRVTTRAQLPSQVWHTHHMTYRTNKGQQLPVNFRLNLLQKTKYRIKRVIRAFCVWRRPKTNRSVVDNTLDTGVDVNVGEGEECQSSEHTTERVEEEQALELNSCPQYVSHIVTDSDDNELERDAMLLRKLSRKLHRRVDMNRPNGNRSKRIARRTTHVFDSRAKSDPKVVLLDSGFVEYFDGKKFRWKRQTLTNCVEYEHSVGVNDIALSAKRLEPQSGFIERPLDLYDRKRHQLIKRNETKWVRLKRARVNQSSTYQTIQHNRLRVEMLLKKRHKKALNGIKMNHKTYGTLRPSLVCIPEEECNAIDIVIKTSQKCLQWLTKSALSYANWDQI
jgi:hypothetical protein